MHSPKVGLKETSAANCFRLYFNVIMQILYLVLILFNYLYSLIAENDYGSNPMPNSFNFNRQSGPSLCTMVTIVPDDALEGGAENFFARLDSSSNSRVILDLERTEVLITDDDGRSMIVINPFMNVSKILLYDVEFDAIT